MSRHTGNIYSFKPDIKKMEFKSLTNIESSFKRIRLMLAVFAFLTISAGWITGPQWLLLAASFVADGAATLLRRLWQRESIFEAHRRHAYQQLATRLGRHTPVTLGYLALNLLVLWPLAWLAGLFPAWGTPIALAVLVVLMTFAWSLGAGAPLQPSSDRK